MLIASFSKSKLNNRLDLTPNQGIWRSARNGLFVELVVGLVVWLPTMLFFGSFTGPAAMYLWGLISGPLAVGLIMVGAGLPTGMIAGLATALTSEFSTSKLDDRLRLAPNQGIWRSAQNGLLSGLIAALVVALPDALLDGLPTALIVSLVVSLPVALIVGLGTFFQHFALRFWLRCTNCLPWNLVAFLDEATERLLLRKVGGGYIFVHRLLLDYLATLNEPVSSENTAPENKTNA